MYNLLFGKHRIFVWSVITYMYYITISYNTHLAMLIFVSRNDNKETI